MAHKRNNYLGISEQVQARTNALRNLQQFSILDLTIRRQDQDFEFFADQSIPLSIVSFFSFFKFVQYVTLQGLRIRKDLKVIVAAALEFI